MFLLYLLKCILTRDYVSHYSSDIIDFYSTLKFGTQAEVLHQILWKKFTLINQEQKSQ